MTRPRSQLVSLAATPYYHCIARCVRRAWLCGDDPYTGKNFDHRKPWLIERLKLLSEVFAIDIAAYAVMSNHYHVVLHVDTARGGSWSDAEVILRWTRLYRGAPLAQEYLDGKILDAAEHALLASLVARWRERLSSLSWFMRCLNEYLARKANAEDGCKGRFWEARFRSQALLDESALLSCMTYVDLNPIRAGITQSLGESDFTSVQQRIRQAIDAVSGGSSGDSEESPTPRLMPFAEAMRQDTGYAAIPFNMKDYLNLVDWTGRTIRPDKKGFIDDKVPGLLATFGLSAHEWQILALRIQKQSITMLNGIERIEILKKRKRVADHA
jgi:REP element-mobilizing transposase RayT